MATIERGRQKAQLQYFLNWFIVALFAAALFSVITGYLFHVWLLFAFTGVLMCFVGVIVFARMRARRGYLQQAAIIVCITFFTSMIVVILLLPALLPSLLLCSVIAALIALPYVSKQVLRFLCIADLIVSIVMLALAQFVMLFAALPPLAATITNLVCAPIALGLVLLLLWQNHSRLSAVLAEVRQSNTALRKSQTSLEDEVADRTADLAFALAELEHRSDAQALLLAEVQQQRTVIRELGVPVLPINRSTLIMPLVGALDSQRLQDIREQALHTIARTHAKRLLLDITGVPLVDKQVAQGLLSVIEAARLLGAESVLIGVRPEVAQAIVVLGVPLDQIKAYPDLQRAIEMSTD